MKYLKTFESRKLNEGIDFTKENGDILNTIDILTSFVDDLSQLKFQEGIIDRRSSLNPSPIQVYVRCGGQRYNLISFAKYVNENINNSISTIEWNLSGSSKNTDDKELDLASEEFLNKLKEFAPNCRINNFRKQVEKDSTMTYTKGKYETTNKINAYIYIAMLDSHKTRYKHLFVR